MGILSILHPFSLQNAIKITCVLELDRLMQCPFRITQHHFMRAFIYSLTILIATGAAFAQTFQTNGNWNTAANWSPAAVPSGTGTNVTLSANPSLNSGSNNIIGNISANNGVQITVNANGKLTLGSAALFGGGTKKSLTFNNNGTLQVNSGSPAGVLEIWGDLIVNNNLQVQITGTLIVHGNIVMNNNAQIQVSGGGDITVGGNVSGGNNAQIQVSGSGSTLSVGGSIALGNGGQIQTSGGGVITAASCSCSGCSSQCGALPVTLISFNVRAASDKVILNWATGTELNFDYFSIERSENGFSFSELAQVKGHGTSNERHDYSYEDSFPFTGKSYYRITTVDFDGYTETFNILAVNYSGEKLVRVFPNPVIDGKLTVELTFTPTEELTFILTDLNGTEKGRYNMRERKATFQIELSSGTYLAKISTVGISKVIRVIVR